MKFHKILNINDFVYLNNERLKVLITRTSLKNNWLESFLVDAKSSQEIIKGSEKFGLLESDEENKTLIGLDFNDKELIRAQLPEREVNTAFDLNESIYIIDNNVPYKASICDIFFVETSTTEKLLYQVIFKRHKKTNQSKILCREDEIFKTKDLLFKEIDRRLN